MFAPARKPPKTFLEPTPREFRSTKVEREREEEKAEPTANGEEIRAKTITES
jgi:hypothetical protein